MFVLQCQVRPRQVGQARPGPNPPTLTLTLTPGTTKTSRASSTGAESPNPDPDPDPRYDQDKSGKLDRVEFSRCLTESQLGFTERQIQAMMLAVDEDENDLIDYSEFANLFENVILEISRQDKIDKMLAGEEAADRLAADLELFLDELMIPLHIAYDIACDGGESCASGAITQLLLVKCPEWGIGEEAMNALCEAVLAYGEALEWAHVVEVIEKLAIPS